MHKSNEKALATVVSSVKNTLGYASTIFETSFEQLMDYIENDYDNSHLLCEMTTITNRIAATTKGASYENGIYGYIRGEYLDGIGWAPPENYVVHYRPWYINALKAKGNIVTSSPYYDASTGQLIISYSKAIYNRNGNFLGVLAMDAFFDNLFGSLTVAESMGYVILLDDKFVIISHPDTNAIGVKLFDFDVDNKLNPKSLNEKLISDLVTKKLTEKHGHNKIIAAAKEISVESTKWYVISVVLKSDFYRQANIVNIILLLTGIFGFFATAYIMYNLNRLKEIADEANTGKSVFLARVSHDLRTPLNAINGFAEIELNKEHSKETANNISKILRSGYMLMQILNDLLDLSKIENGKLEIIKKEYNVGNLIEDVIYINKFRIDGKNIKLQIKFDKNIPQKLFGDEIRVKQIFNNILSNAFKYTENGIISVYFSVKRLSPDLCQLIAVVKDTGIGIKKENISKLFHEYNRFDVEKHRNTEGTGLGLNITKQLAEIMGGDVSVESEYGKGSTFTVTIIQGIIGDKFITDETAARLENLNFIENNEYYIHKIDFVSLPNVNVLVVDDVQTNLDVALGMLSPYKMKVDCVLSGEEALSIISDGGKKYDILFVDHIMPGMDGIETVRKIRKINSEYTRNLPIVAFTANTLSDMEKMFLEMGFNAFISKPIDTDKLDEIIHKWVYDRLSESEKLKAPRNTDKSAFIAQEKPQIKPDTHKIEGLDFEKGVKRFNGSYDAYYRVISSFVKNIASKINAIDDVSSKNIADYAITIHGIKGSCYGISANLFGDEAAVLEKFAKDGDLEKIWELNPKFIEKIKLFIEKLQNLLNEINSSKEEKPKMILPDTNLLKKILVSAQNYDMEELRNSVNDLDKFRYEKDNELVTEIKQKCDVFDYDGIARIISKFLNNSDNISK
ncbi:MAG: response regulator [Chitinispirillales bacterium]|nr:response regulator [Chitinispirillales bacterium]